MLQKIFPQTVKNRVLLTMTSTMLVLVLIPALLFYRSSMNNIISMQLKAGQGVYNQVLKTLEKRSENMGMLSLAVSEMPRVQEYFYLDDRENLLGIMMPLYKKLQKNYGVNVFHFHKKPATSFLRLQKPEKFGDDLSGFRHTVLKANKEKKMVIALEKGKAGLSNRAVMPIFYENEHIGSVEFGLPVNDDILMEIKAQIGSDIALVVPDGDGFKYQAKTHKLIIPKKMYPFLSQMMKSDKIMTKKILINGREVVNTFGPIKDFSGNIVAVLAVPIDITNLLADVKNSALKIIGIGVGILLLSLAGVFLFFQRMVNRPVNILKEKLKKASSGDLTQKMEIGKICDAGKTSKNEFAELGLHFNRLLDSIQKMVREIVVNSNELNESATMLTSVSGELSAGATQTAERSENAAKATGEMSRNMDSVAIATEEAAANVQDMTSRTEGISKTIGKIQESTGQAKEITNQAVDETVEISEKVNELGIAAQDIGKVTETISEISAQTNLLALNATIEAARAGEAGKGFAVVANEIKDLAKQTAEATGEISSRIEGIQNSTGVTVAGIEKITGIIKNIDKIVSNIAGSLDEQGHTLTEMTGNIQQAGAGIGEVAANVVQSSTVSREIATDVEQVNSAAVELSRGSSNVQESAGELKQLSEDLRGMVSRFKLQ